MHTIELSKFTENLKNDLPSLMERVKTSLDLWLAFLTRHNLLDRENLKSHNRDVGKALEVLEVMNFTKDEREKYDEHLKCLWIEVGKVKGIEIGKTEGKIETAKNLLKLGALKLEQIAAVTSLSLIEIKKLSE